MPRYRPTLAQSQAERDRRKLDESVRCPTHNAYYNAYRRLGARIVPSTCPRCHQDRVDEDRRQQAGGAD